MWTALFLIGFLFPPLWVVEGIAYVIWVATGGPNRKKNIKNNQEELVRIRTALERISGEKQCPTLAERAGRAVGRWV